MGRKSSVKAEWVLLGWTAVFCAFLALSWKAPSPVETERAVEYTVTAEAPKGPLDLNEASLEDLTALPGIGETLARRILDYRAEHGPFRGTEELMEVSGIGEGKYGALEGLITAD